MTQQNLKALSKALFFRREFFKFPKHPRQPLPTHSVKIYSHRDSHPKVYRKKVQQKRAKLFYDSINFKPKKGNSK